MYLIKITATTTMTIMTKTRIVTTPAVSGTFLPEEVASRI